MPSSSQLNLIFDSGLYALVILGILFFMSFFAWGVTIVKWKESRKQKKTNEKLLKQFHNVENFRDFASGFQRMPACPVKDVAGEILDEVKKLSPYVSYDSLHHRGALLEEAIERAIEKRRIEDDKSLSYLALCSSLSPFLGLLGTVWGIMSSFFEIGAQGSAELSVVAPGIAAALITTVGGLIVAIPASAAFNLFTSQNNKSETVYANFGSEVLALFKRGDLAVLEAERGK